MKSFSACVLKLTAVCNLDCSYCYMFNLADKVHTRVPPLLSVQTALKTLDRIVEHLLETGRTEFDLTLHGGEPTMWCRWTDSESFSTALRKFAAAVSSCGSRCKQMPIASMLNCFPYSPSTRWGSVSVWMGRRRLTTNIERITPAAVPTGV